MKAGIPEALTRGLMRSEKKPGEEGYFPTYFVPDAEEVDEAIAWREQILKLSQSAATLSQEESNLAFAIRRVHAYKAEYDRIKEVLATRTKDLKAQRDYDRPRLKIVMLQLEEALRDAGELDEAMKYTINADRKAKLKAAKNATTRNDRDDCGCPDKVMMVDGVEVVFPHLMVVKRVFSKKHFNEALAEERKTGVVNESKRFPYLIRCTHKKCSFRNVTHVLPPALVREREVRGRFSQKALAENAALRVHDSEVLRRG